MSPLSRRQFLGSSLTVGAGAVALGLTGAGADVLAPSTADALAPPAAPKRTQSFVSRPDLTPPGMVVSAAPGVPARPSRIFTAPFSILPGLPAASQGLMIADLNGNLVWWKPMPLLSAKPFNFRVQTFQGRSVLTWYQGLLVSAPTVPGGGMPGRYGGQGMGVICDDTYSQITTVHAKGWGTDLHEFLITPEDTALVTAYETDGNLVIGHAQEVGIGGSNELIWDWKSYPAVRTPQSYAGSAGDYFHINSVDLWPGAARNVLISSRNTSAVYLISRSTKRIIWRLGGKSSSFAGGTGTRFSYQHDARPLADGSGVSLFDDASSGVPEAQSWGKVITLDQKTMRASLRHEFAHSTAFVRAGNSGNCQLLPTGGHVVGWGAGPYISLFGPSGDAVEAPMLLDARLPDGYQSYRSFMFDWTGRPPVSELVAVVRNAGATGHFNAYVSWNGATQVAYYEVSAGRSASALKTVTGPVVSSGFETAIAVAAAGATDFQVSAFTTKGQLLGRTRVVGVS
jgi:hypothetical protein